MEIWKEIEGYPRFEVSNLGRIRRDYLYVIDPIKENKYHYVRISNKEVSKHKLVHILVLEAFKSRPEGNWEVNHIDCQKNNNHLHNLEWVTRSQNMAHAFNSGQMDHVYRKGKENPRTGYVTPEKVKEKQRVAHNKNGDHPNYVLTDEQVLYIKKKRFSGAPLKELAEEFKVTTTNISLICSGKRRADVGPEYTLVPKVRGRKMKRIFVWVKGVKVYC